MLKSKLSLVAAAFLFLLLPAAVLASPEDGLELIPTILDTISFILIVIAITVSFKLTRLYGESAIGVSMVYFLIGTFFLGSVRLFLFLTEGGVDGGGLVFVGEITAGIVWHVFHWLSVIMYFIAVRMLLGSVDNSSKPSYYKAAIVGISSLIFVLLSITTTSLFNDTLEKFGGTIMDRFGLIHFISFVVGGVLAVYLLKVKSKLIPAIAVIASPMIIVVALFSVSHFWELLTESWKFIDLPMSVIEQTEQFITFPAYFLVVYAFWRSKRLLDKIF